VGATGKREKREQTAQETALKAVNAPPPQGKDEWGKGKEKRDHQEKRLQLEVHEGAMRWKKKKAGDA